MNTGLGYNKATLGHGLKLIWRHEGALYHLEGLAGVILAARDTSAHHCAAAKCFGQLHSCLAGRSETAVKVDLAVIHNHFSAFRTVVFLKLTCDTLYNGYQHESSGTRGGEHQLQRLDGRAGAQLICKEDHSILESPTVLVGHGEDLTVQILENQGYHEILGLILLGQYDKDGRFLITELLSINGGIKAENLLHL